MTDFSRPQRMGLGAFAVIFIKSFKNIAAALLIYVFIKIAGDEGADSVGEILARLAIGIGAAAAVALMAALADYLPKKFYVRDGSLVFARGLLKRETTTIPLGRIHSLRTRRSLAYRLFGMRGITIDTLAAKGEEIELIINEKDWHSLLGRIHGEERRREDVAPDVPPEYRPTHTVGFGNREMVYGALCQNHLKGAVILLIMISGLLDTMVSFGDVGTETLYEAGDYLDRVTLSAGEIAGLLVAVYIGIVVLWVGKIFLKNYGMTLTYDKKQLAFAHGLLTRAGSRFAYNKICTITVKCNILERRFGLATLMLRQALNATATKVDENLKIYSRDSSDFFLRWWLGEGYGSEEEIVSAGPRRGSLMRLLFPNRISLRDSYVMIRGGRLAEKSSYIKYGNIEVVRLRRTPLTPLTGRMAVKLSTSGTTFTVRGVKEAEARRVRELLLR